MSLPPDAAVQQQPQPVVFEVAETVPDPLHLLDEQVDRLGGAVGAAGGLVPGEDLGLPGAHGAGQAGQLKELHTVAPAVEALQRGPGGGQVSGGVDRTQQFLALPGGRHLAETVTGSESRAQPCLAAASELLGGRQQQLADPVQRIALATPMPEGGLLGPPADLVDHCVGQPDGVEVVTTTVACPSGTTSALA